MFIYLNGLFNYNIYFFIKKNKNGLLKLKKIYISKILLIESTWKPSNRDEKQCDRKIKVFITTTKKGQKLLSEKNEKKERNLKLNFIIFPNYKKLNAFIISHTNRI